MQRALNVRIKFGKSRMNSFTLVELLVVIAIIGILMAITLAAASGVMAMAARSRAKGEIQAMSTALESYKNDNGAYPQVNTMVTNTYMTFDGTPTYTNYIYSAQILYQSLSGKTNFLDTPIAGVKAYASFKSGQVGNTKAASNSGFVPSASSYLQDPWGYAYGYNTGTTNGAAAASAPYNGAGFFDLWSTAGSTMQTPNQAITNTAAWISNWQ